MALDFVPTGYKKKANGLYQKYEKIMLTLLALGSLLMAVYMGVTFFLNYTNQNAKAPQLYSLAYQDIERLKKDPQTEGLYATRDDIDDLFAAHEEFVEERQSFERYKQLLANPYNNFLQYRYLPSLNIWKNHYTQTIDTTLVGEKFLNENPFTDLALIESRVRAFEEVGDVAKELGVTAVNQVKDVTFSPIKEFDNGYFAIPISLTFESVDRRSLLLLMEKLSMTSHHKNISLINEFFFHLREAIKEEYSQELEAMNTSLDDIALTGSNDLKLGYLFDKRTQNDGDNFVNTRVEQRVQNGQSRDTIPTMDTLINTALRNATGCEEQSKEECEYLFREKFRTLPYLIYPITNTRRSKASVIKEFLQETLPPVINIQSFTFDEVGVRGILNPQSKFEGVLTIEVYGRGISTGEIDEIAHALGTECFVDNRMLSMEEGLKKIDQTIVEIGKIDALDTERADQLFELKEIVERIEQEYITKSPFNKVIKLFELYRMLNETSLCEK